MSLLTLYGLVAVTAMLLFYWLEDRWHGFTFAFGLACLASSGYGWPGPGPLGSSRPSGRSSPSPAGTAAPIRNEMLAGPVTEGWYGCPYSSGLVRGGRPWEQLTVDSCCPRQTAGGCGSQCDRKLSDGLVLRQA
jgi:hypothetical protein